MSDVTRVKDLACTKNLSDSESEICNSSCCSSESEKLPWLENVKSDGSLFYIERDSNLDAFLEGSFNHSYPVESWSHIRQSKSKLNPAEKIKRWMKDRRKKVRKSFPLLKSNRDETNLNSFQPIDKFLPLQFKDIFVDVDASKMSMNSKLSLAERLLGLKFGSLEENYSASDKPYIIGINACEDTPDVKIGDCVISINELDVDMNNIEDVLRDIPIPSKVKLNIMSSGNQSSQFLSPKQNDLIKELLSDTSVIQAAKLKYQHVPHGLFFLSIENGLLENEDVIYKYPSGDTALFQLKGMFLTLGHMISDVASPPLLSCTIMVQGEFLHVGFVKEESNIMALALPAVVASTAEVQHFSTGLAKFLKYQFSSLSKAFIFGKKESYLDNFLTLYFKHYLSSSCTAQNIMSEPHLLDILPSAHWLPLPNDIKTEIDDILSELESSDFGNNSEGFYGNRRIFNIFGSCLFYKGYLLCSHLPRADLLDIYSYLHYNRILELTSSQPVSQIIIWKEVYPSRHQECLLIPDPEFDESHGRWFMLIVVMQHCVLAVLLDDGGCALDVEECSPPEPFYVEEVQNTLFILQDCGITAATEKLLHFCVFPVVSPDLFFKDNSSLNSVFASNVSIHSSGLNMSSDHSNSHSSLTGEKEDHVGSESDTESTYSNDSTEIASFEKRFRSYSVSTGSTTKSHASSECSQIGKCSENEFSQQTFSSLPNLNGSACASSDGICLENSFRMMTGFGNNLFYYLHMDPVEGIFIAPIVPNSSAPGSLHKSILNSFHQCCLNMRITFERSLRNGEITKANIKTKYGVNTFLQNGFEQGVLFECNQMHSMKQKASHRPVQFWVTGRLFFSPEPREVYVCHHDAIAQDIVEMAFHLGFGLSF